MERHINGGRGGRLVSALATLIFLVMALLPLSSWHASIQVARAQTAQWTQLIADGTPGSPSARADHTAVWDTQANRMLVFGGYDGNGYHNDLWQYTDAGGWMLLTPEGAAGSPPARSRHTAVWDSQNNRMLVFGGSDASTYFNDLWQYTAANGWRVVTAQGDINSPSPRWGAVMAWDSQDNRALLFGGTQQESAYSCNFYNSLTNQRNDLWQFTMAGGWKLLSDEDANCSGLYPRFFPSAVWDSYAGRLLMFAGWAGGGLLTVDDLWQYTDAGGWANLVRFRSGPMPTRQSHTAVWDSQANRMLMFGGEQDGSPSYNDLWQYTSSGWSLLTAQGAAGSPPGRNNHTAVWDSQTNRMLVFGGMSILTNHYYSDLWQYANPAPLTITTTSPLPSGTVGVAYTQTLQASGGTAPYTWIITAGSLPPGLALDAASGVISGIPTTAGTFSFTVQVTDSSSETATQQFTFSPPPPSGSAGSTYSVPISITPPASGGGGGGSSSCTSYAVTSGTLPPGLSLDPSTGIVSGTPISGGTYSFTIQCGTSGGQTATQNFTITIDNPAPTLTSLSPGSANAGGPAFTLTVNGTGFVGTSTVQWNGANRATTYVSPSQLTAAIGVADIASHGTASVTVVNPVPGGGTSNALSFTIASPDTTAPSCALTGMLVGPPKQILITVRDSDGGLKSIVVTESNNATTPIPAFTPGTTSPVVVTATKINQSQGAQVALRVTDMAGNVTNCDPVLTAISRDEADPTVVTATGIGQSEHLLHLYNGDPGLSHIIISVNGIKVQERDLEPNEQRTVDIASALQPGSDNTVTLTARGPQRGEATIVIADS